MRIIFLLSIVIFSTSSYGQSKNTVDLKKFFQEFSPCGMPIYCYEYDFDLKGKNMLITTRLFNSKNRILTETVNYTIPVINISEVGYFNYGSENIYIMMFGDDISKVKNGVLEKVSFMPLDFNKNKLNIDAKDAFKNSFQSLIKELQEL